MQLADVQNNFPDVICTPNASYKPCLKRNRKKADVELITSTSRINGTQPFISSHFPSAVTHTVSLGHRESGWWGLPWQHIPAHAPPPLLHVHRQLDKDIP